jgi:hypothetical protein
MSNNDKKNNQKCDVFDEENEKCYSSYYTTWSFYAIIYTTIFAVIIIPIFRKYKYMNSSSILSYMVLSIIIGFSINSIAVAIASQYLLDEQIEKKIEQKIEEKQFSPKYVKEVTSSNLKHHLLPVILSLFLLIIITSVPWSGNKYILFILSCLVPFLFILIWSCVSIKTKNNKHVNFINKTNVMYDNPNNISKILLPLNIIVFSAFYVFIIRGKQ